MSSNIDTNTDINANLACMIDLETLGLTQDCVILAAGAVFWDLDREEFKPETTIYTKFNWTAQLGKLDSNTLLWHVNNTPQEVLRENFSGANTKNNLRDFLDNLQSLWNYWKSVTVWSKGIDFDVSILDYRYKEMGVKSPWSYKQKMCYRTVRKIADKFPVFSIKSEIEEMEKEQTHTALQDALLQARILHKISKTTGIV